MRGHTREFCKERLSNLEEAYNNAKRGGLYTKKRDPQWNFYPPYGLEKTEGIKASGNDHIGRLDGGSEGRV